MNIKVMKGLNIRDYFELLNLLLLWAHREGGSRSERKSVSKLEIRFTPNVNRAFESSQT